MSALAFKIATLFSITIILACNLTANVNAQNSPTRAISTNIRSFTVPFKVDNSQKNYIEVQLYMSSDYGKTWNFYDKQDVAGNGFRFSSQGDGEYWFALKTLDRDRQLVPSGKISQPELRIIVDTADPRIELDTNTDAAGRIITSWNISDDFLDPNSIRISHRGVPAASNQSKWIDIPFKPTHANANRNKSFVDRVAWWPKTNASRVEVKVEIADTAGNIATESAFISLPNITRSRSNTGSTTAQNRSNQNGSWTRQQPAKQVAISTKPKNVVCENGVCRIVESPQNKIATRPKTNQQYRAPNTAPKVGSSAEYLDPPVPSGYIPQQNKPDVANSNAPDKSSIVWKSEAGQWGNSKRIDNASTLNQNDFPINTAPQTVLGLNSRFNDVPVVAKRKTRPMQDFTHQTTSETDNMVISQSTTYGQGKPNQSSVSESIQRQQPFQATPQSFARTTPQMNQVSAPRKFVPPFSNDKTQTLSVNTRRFNLNYDVQAIDPSGVGKVVLWSTRDSGRTWNSLAVDPDNASPFPVEVDAEGIYGFRVVINSRDGITGKPPVSGDEPDITVQVDLSIPKVALTSAPYGSGADVGKLIIHWNAFDEHMTERPIRLAYSPTSDGPWTTIKDRLRNTGSYAWKVPAQVPQEIYLRIEAQDVAKNKGIYQLTSPIDISGLVPRGRILGVDPVR